MPSEYTLAFEVVEDGATIDAAPSVSLAAVKQKYARHVTAFPILATTTCWIQFCHVRPDGSKDSFLTIAKRKPGAKRWENTARQFG